MLEAICNDRFKIIPVGIKNMEDRKNNFAE